MVYSRLLQECPYLRDLPHCRWRYTSGLRHLLVSPAGKLRSKYSLQCFYYDVTFTDI